LTAAAGRKDEQLSMGVGARMCNGFLTSLIVPYLLIFIAFLLRGPERANVGYTG
jgi:hypothetical protein